MRLPLASLLLLCACGEPPVELLVTPPAPSSNCSECELFSRVAPGTPVRVSAQWMGWCEYGTGSRHTCAAQDFTVEISCGQIACSVDNIAGINAGNGFSGWAGFEVTPTEPGELVVTIDLTHQETSETDSTTFAALQVVVPTSLGVECARIEVEDGTARACLADEDVDYQGIISGDQILTDSLRFGVYGEANGERVILVPSRVDLCIGGNCQGKTCGLTSSYLGGPACAVDWLYPTAGTVELRGEYDGLAASTTLSMH